MLKYVIQTGIEIFNRDGYTLVEMTNEGVFSPSIFSLNKTHGFAVAAAISYGDLQQNNTQQDDPEIG